MEPDERKKPAFDELAASLKAEAKTLLDYGFAKYKSSI